ncbi:collagen alpha-1(I) chain-like [Mustela erminea]|uniref:collagen alpha-1(I) chain-like n=1 Tax=Mustela erminea TaxID=36723 RepID=UPI0013873C3C|nr:collagen alpha-1(I) chain-like [Mustela erminea]
MGRGGRRALAGAGPGGETPLPALCLSALGRPSGTGRPPGFSRWIRGTRRPARAREPALEHRVCRGRVYPLTGGRSDTAWARRVLTPGPDPHPHPGGEHSGLCLRRRGLPRGGSSFCPLVGRAGAGQGSVPVDPLTLRDLRPCLCLRTLPPRLPGPPGAGACGSPWGLAGRAHVLSSVSRRHREGPWCMSRGGAWVPVCDCSSVGTQASCDLRLVGRAHNPGSALSPSSAAPPKSLLAAAAAPPPQRPRARPPEALCAPREPGSCRRGGVRSADGWCRHHAWPGGEAACARPVGTAVCWLGQGGGGSVGGPEVKDGGPRAGNGGPCGGDCQAGFGGAPGLLLLGSPACQPHSCSPEGLSSCPCSCRRGGFRPPPRCPQGARAARTPPAAGAAALCPAPPPLPDLPPPSGPPFRSGSPGGRGGVQVGSVGRPPASVSGVSRPGQARISRPPASPRHTSPALPGSWNHPASALGLVVARGPGHGVATPGGILGGEVSGDVVTPDTAAWCR